MSAPQLSVLFFLQMFVILAACRLVGAAARRVGQPLVVGEMVAGVLLGPSLLGLLAPGAQAALFPPESLKVLFVTAQVGIGLYMFFVGIEFDVEVFRRQMRSAAAVSLAGMIVPFALGAALAPWLMQMPGLFGEQVRSHEAALFLGAAIAITAFPMLARIIYERGLAGTQLGTLSLAAGAMGDAVAWCVLAVVLASFGGGAVVAVKAIGGGVVFTVLMLTVGRLLLTRLGAAAERDGRLTPTMLSTCLMLLMLAAWATDAAGIHAVFGGFLLGVAMPRGLLTRELQRDLEPFTVVFLLPMFFTYSGLNTRLDMVNSLPLLGVALVVLAASCLGKFGACWAAARLTGSDNRLALAVGALMNARGMMELILLNIGLQKGIIQPPLFAMLVLMAVVTTLMASPVFELVYGRHARAEGKLRETPPVDD
ncbi:MAG: cation:proton antiporter [Limisphaerales bacterium]|nr:MAG: cation:proton antiporter [Limisphaerales bacterium]KAG0508797.1 MAG: cation:proton antiporter [Limisphaerales bacterium]TXT50512.1 MAG: cation:proton antiporter [Limisphaerales bacterium]